jgi:hypothetical protein
MPKERRMVSPYLLRPLRTLEEAMRDIKKLREYWRGAPDAAPSSSVAETDADAVDVKPKEE